MITKIFFIICLINSIENMNWCSLFILFLLYKNKIKIKLTDKKFKRYIKNINNELYYFLVDKGINNVVGYHLNFFFE